MVYLWESKLLLINFMNAHLLEMKFLCWTMTCLKSMCTVYWQRQVLLMMLYIQQPTMFTPSQERVPKKSSHIISKLYSLAPQLKFLWLVEGILLPRLRSRTSSAVNLWSRMINLFFKIVRTWGIPDMVIQLAQLVISTFVWQVVELEQEQHAKCSTLRLISGQCFQRWQLRDTTTAVALLRVDPSLCFAEFAMIHAATLIALRE